MKKQILALVTSMSVITARKKLIKIAKTVKIIGTNKNREYLGINLVQIIYIQCPIIF